MEVYVFNNVSVARGFVAAREKLGWSHYRLAKESGLPWRTVVRLEQEGTNPTINTVATAAAALGYRVRFYATPDNEMARIWEGEDVEYLPVPHKPLE